MISNLRSLKSEVTNCKQDLKIFRNNFINFSITKKSNEGERESIERKRNINKRKGRKSNSSCKRRKKSF
jgi:hypothetical protein